MSIAHDMLVPVVGEPDTPVEIVDQIRTIEANVTEHVQTMAKELKITQISCELSHLPCEATGNTAFAHARVHLQDGRQADGVGSASADRFKTKNPTLLATMALTHAKVKAISEVQMLAVPEQTVIDVPVQQVSKGAPVPSAPASSAQKKEYKHRHDKKLSSGQLNCLTKMSLERGLSPQAVAMQHVGKGSHELSSAEAHDLIRAIAENRIK